MGVFLEYSDKRSEEYSDKRSEELKFYIQSSSDKSTQTRGVRSSNSTSSPAKQIFWRSQIEKQRASSAFWEGNLTEAAGELSFPTNPILASDLDLPPPLTIRSPSRARIMLACI